jgi:small nuclear ribonucleoprotein D2
MGPGGGWAGWRSPTDLFTDRNNKKLLWRVKDLDRHCNMVLEVVKEMWTELPK